MQYFASHYCLAPSGVYMVVRSKDLITHSCHSRESENPYIDQRNILWSYVLPQPPSKGGILLNSISQSLPRFVDKD